MIQFLSVGSHLCYMLPSDPASRQRPCISLPLTSTRLGRGLSLSIHPVCPARLNTPPPEEVGSVGPKGAVWTVTIERTSNKLTGQSNDLTQHLLPLCLSLDTRVGLNWCGGYCQSLRIATPGLSAKPQPSDHAQRTWVSTLRLNLFIRIKQSWQSIVRQHYRRVVSDI